MGKLHEALLRAEVERAEREAEEAERDAWLLHPPGEIRWEGAIFERVTAIERQLGALEETLGKRAPEAEERLLHLLDTRLASVETTLLRHAASLATQLTRESERTRDGQRRLLLVLVLVGALVLLF